MRRDFAAEVVLDGEPVPVSLLIGITLAKGMASKYNEACFDVRLVFPDDSLLHSDGLFSRRTLARVANSLEAVATGKSDGAYMREIDYYLELSFDRIPGDNERVAVSGAFLKPLADTRLSPQWREIITVELGQHPGTALRGLLMSRSDVQALASLLREFLSEVGDALPRRPPFDDD